jgi:hypothetical protein
VTLLCVHRLDDNLPTSMFYGSSDDSHANRGSYLHSIDLALVASQRSHEDASLGLLGCAKQ